jgi:2-polyprenyl-3-methyl-5-hydroxy-6-metoxy-1,4-benzoquinol methylase
MTMIMIKTNETFKYPGSELEIFSHALNWRRYKAAVLRPYIGSSVLEVGAGIGSTTSVLCKGSQDRWLCLEPDIQMAKTIEKLLQQKKLPPCCDVKSCRIQDISGNELFDTILYIDVLEHISDDAGEMLNAASHLVSKGYLIVLSPAYPWLFSPFDKAIGHFRRYNRKSLGALSPPGCVKVKSAYLDSMGVLLSLANKLLLRSPYPTPTHIKIWDHIIVPMSRISDPLVRYSFGRSIIVIWKRI